MLPMAVIPMNDPNGIYFSHLKAIDPSMKQLFSRIFISIPHETQKSQSAFIEWVKRDDFYDVVYHEQDLSIGEDFLTLYSHAASACAPAQILHLCFMDRMAYTLQSEHREVIMADILSAGQDSTPLIFQRSDLAWQTHPKNYQEIEGMLTLAGNWLFGKSLDFAWCHMVIQAGQLQQVISKVKRRDISFFAEMVLNIKDDVETKDVDWLSWEDPFIYSDDPLELKRAREQSLDETHKRLAYVIPMLKLMYEYNANG